MFSVFGSIWNYAGDGQRLGFVMICIAAWIVSIEILEDAGAISETVASWARMFWWFGSVAMWIDYPRLFRLLFVWRA